jgi:hypothetical protein
MKHNITCPCNINVDDCDYHKADREEYIKRHYGKDYKSKEDLEQEGKSDWYPASGEYHPWKQMLWDGNQWVEYDPTGRHSTKAHGYLQHGALLYINPQDVSTAADIDVLRGGAPSMITIYNGRWPSPELRDYAGEVLEPMLKGMVALVYSNFTTFYKV